MILATTIHFILAFLVAICAAAFSWNALGRRVVNAVLGLQVLAGLFVLATQVAAHVPLGSKAVLHVGAAFAAVLCYGFASRAGRRAGGERTALLLSLLGLLGVGLSMFWGFRMEFAG